MRRTLHVRAFRNIGFRDRSPHDETLVVDHARQPGEFGALVIIFGEANSGKSNLLAALEAAARQGGMHNSQSLHAAQELRLSLEKELAWAKSQAWEKVKELEGKLKAVEEQEQELQQLDTRQNVTTLYGEEACSHPSAQFECQPSPCVYRYEFREISDQELRILPTEGSRLLDSVLRSVGEAPSCIQEAYRAFARSRDKGILTALQDRLNGRLAAVAHRFNRLFQPNGTPYVFQLDLEREAIFFCLARGDHTIFLQQQSSGFRWAFSLFFNFLYSNDFSSGDIVLIDAPEGHLQGGALRELRLLLKEFAIHNDLAVVIATQAPSLVALDNLEELRLVSTVHNVAVVENQLPPVDCWQENVRLALQEAVLMERLISVESRLVLVEGMAAYNYLVAFKQLLGIQNILFLPVGRVSDAAIQRCFPCFPCPLVRLAEGSAAAPGPQGAFLPKTIWLHEMSPRFTTVASLFSQEDAVRYTIGGSEDESSSWSFKGMVERLCHRGAGGGEEGPSSETMENFRELFRRLSE